MATNITGLPNYPQNTTTYLRGDGTFATSNANTILVPGGVGTPSYNDIQDVLNETRSAGRITGGVPTPKAPADGTVDISAIEGMIFDANSLGSNLIFFKLAGANVTPADGKVSWLYVDYNAGTPQFGSTITRSDVHEYDQFIIGRVWRDGTAVEVLNTGMNLYNRDRRAQDKEINVFGDMYRASGGVISQSAGTRTLAVTDGLWYTGYTSLTTTGYDTNVSGTFSTFYRSGAAAWTETGALTQVPVTQYNRLSDNTLQDLTANRYGVYWVFICPEGDLYLVYGQGDYTLAQAIAAQVPASLPPYCIDWARLVGKITFQKSSDTLTVETVFSNSFTQLAVTDHGALAGLTDDDHTQYIKDSEYDAKGKILIGTGAGTFTALAVGADGKILTAASGEASGVKWDTSTGVTNGDSHDHSGGDGATIPIGGGGTGQTTAQAAIDALTAVSGATIGHALVKDADGHATWAAPAPGHMDVAILNEQAAAPSTLANHFQVYGYTVTGTLPSGTAFLCHCDGSDASTSFTDSAAGKTITANGSAQVDTAQSKFGGASLLCDGDGDFLSVADSADWAFGTGKFAVSFWVRFNAIRSGSINFCGQYTDATHAWELTLEATAAHLLHFYAYTSGTYFDLHFTCPWTPTTGQWYHVEIDRNGTTAGDWYLFIDGVAQTLTKASGAWEATIADINGTMRFGQVIVSQGFDGWMDELLVVKGNVIHTAGFTPPTGAHSATVYALKVMLPDGTEKTVTLT